MSFQFTDDNLKKAQAYIEKYPQDKQASAILPLLDLAQRQNDGWLSQEVIEYVANFLNMPAIRVYEVASFYTMFNLKPVGRYHVQVCGTTPCWLRGAEDIMHACEAALAIKKGETTLDNLFTLSEVECLGACVNAPVVQINDDYYENLSPESVQTTIESLRLENQNAAPLKKKTSSKKVKDAAS